MLNRMLQRVGLRDPALGETNGLRPVATARFTLALEKTENGNRELRLFSDQGENLLSLELDGKKSTVSYESKAQHHKRLALREPQASGFGEGAPRGGRPGDEGWSNEPGSETAATHLYRSMRRHALGTVRVGLGRQAALVAVGAFLVVGLSFFLSPVGSGPYQAALANSAPAGPAGRIALPPGVIAPGGLVAGGAPSVPRDAVVEGSERKQMAALKGVVNLRDKGEGFFVFSDPNCSYCKELEATLDTVEAKFKPVVIPVAFREGSRDLASAVLCSSNPGAEWKKMMASGAAPAAKSCEKGLAQLDENMQLFRQLRLTATPTIVSPKKWVMVNGAATPAELEKILQN